MKEDGKGRDAKMDEEDVSKKNTDLTLTCVICGDNISQGEEAMTISKTNDTNDSQELTIRFYHTECLPKRKDTVRCVVCGDVIDMTIEDSVSVRLPDGKINDYHLECLMTL